MRFRTMIPAASAAALLTTGLVIAPASGASAAAHKPPACVQMKYRSDRQVDVYNDCNRQYIVKAIFKHGKDVTQGIGAGKAYRLTSGTFAKIQKIVVLN